MQRFYKIITYGCQMNVHESEKIAGILERLGYSVCEDIINADVIVYNTCCIRENAENHVFGNLGMIKKLKAEKRDLIIAVCGCLTQQKGKAEYLHEKFPFVDIIIGTHNLHKLEKYILLKRSQKKAVIRVEEDTGEVVEGEEPYRTSYPNAWVNITYGCNNFCSYCIVPYVRGRERSRKSQNILDEVKKLVECGYKEITLLGQNVNSYGNGTNDISFPELLRRVAAIEGKFRVRFMTSHPKDFSEELVRAIAENDKICNCVHLPVQSGSNAVLKAMNRKYTAEEYLKKIEMLKKHIPDCTVSTDIIVGFPNESDEDFKATLNLVKTVKYYSAFTFVYSKREGTVAAKMPNQIPEDVSKKRITELIECVNDLTRKQSSEYVGQTIELLCEDYDEKKGMYLGRDEYGRMGYFKSDKNEVGEFVKITVRRANGISLIGDLSAD